MKSSNTFEQYADFESNCNLKPKPNPFAFTISNANSKKIKWVSGSNGHLRATTQEPGQCYLKCTYIVYFRSHDGYCSETEDPENAGYELETQKFVGLYFSIPSDLSDGSGNINAELLDDQANLINSDKTAHYFKTWSTESSCCGVCGYTDLYWPQFIEWVKIV